MLIVDIGNAHFGNIVTAKRLIKAAYESGADIVKGQAFKGERLTGSMPNSFYRQCEFTFHQCIELIDYARSIGCDMFYSIFDEEYEELENYQIWSKIAGNQYVKRSRRVKDEENVIFSIPKYAKPINVKKAEPLYVTDYLTDKPELNNIRKLMNFYGRNVGYSDHTLGINNCLMAYEIYGCNIIEKHFTLEKYKYYQSLPFRDTIHGATPKELEKLAKELEK